MQTYKTNKPHKTSRAEKVANDFLLQLAYAIAASIFMLFVYNARMFRYSMEIGRAMNWVLWVLFGIVASLGIVFLVLWKIKGRKGFKITGIYLFVTALMLLWVTIAPNATYQMHQVAPWIPFVNAQRVFDVLFIGIGVSVPVELAVYLVRYARLKQAGSR